MFTMYKTGVETRQNILRCAKKLFYENGFKDTSVFSICREAEVQPGTFTYHFPKKNDLLHSIYTDYMQSCIAFLDSCGLDLHPAEHHLYVLALYYSHLYCDKKLVSFHREVMEIASMNVWFDNPRRLISGFSGEGKEINDNERFDLFVKADNAARRELNLDFINEGDYSLPGIMKLLKDIYTINAKLFDVDYSLMEQYLEGAYGFALKNMGARLRLL